MTDLLRFLSSSPMLDAAYTKSKGSFMAYRFIPAVSAATVVLALAVSAGPGWSMGSVAVGLPSDVASDGFALGVSYNYGSAAEADTQAMNQCHSFMDAPESTRNLCRVYQNFHDQCFAVAMDPEPGTYGVGFRVASTQYQADTDAMNDCIKTSTKDRATFCKISYRTCDGNAS
jgi:hypothetical protein